MEDVAALTEQRAAVGYDTTGVSPTAKLVKLLNLKGDLTRRFDALALAEDTVGCGICLKYEKEVQAMVDHITPDADPTPCPSDPSSTVPSTVAVPLGVPLGVPILAPSLAPTGVVLDVKGKGEVSGGADESAAKVRCLTCHAVLLALANAGPASCIADIFCCPLSLFCQV